MACPNAPKRTPELDGIDWVAALVDHEETCEVCRLVAAIDTAGGGADAVAERHTQSVEPTGPDADERF